METTRDLEDVCETVRRLKLNGNLLNDTNEIEPLMDHFSETR